MSHRILIKHVKRVGLIVPIKEIKFVLFHHTNTKTIINEALITKKIKLRATDEKWSMAITNMTACYSSKTPKSTSDKPYDLDQIKASGVSISTGYRWKSKSEKKRVLLLDSEDKLWASVKKQK